MSICGSAARRDFREEPKISISGSATRMEAIKGTVLLPCFCLCLAFCTKNLLKGLVGGGRRESESLAEPRKSDWLERALAGGGGDAADSRC